MSRRIPAPDLAQDAVRFLVAGLANTGLTIAAYQVAVTFLSPPVAYALAWALGLVFVYFVYPSRVFVGGRNDRRSRILTIIVYLAGFGIGQVALLAFIATGGDQRAAIFSSLVITTIFNFILIRALLRKIL